MSGDTHLTHIDEKGDVRMVDVSQKPDTERVAVAEGFISMHPETLALIVEGKAAKGDVLACARVAGVMAAKQTSTLIPMCHPLNITKAKVECTPVLEGEREDGPVAARILQPGGNQHGARRAHSPASRTMRAKSATMACMSTWGTSPGATLGRKVATSFPSGLISTMEAEWSIR